MREVRSIRKGSLFLKGIFVHAFFFFCFVLFVCLFVFVFFFFLFLFFSPFINPLL